jgi:hypothetical protein
MVNKRVNGNGTAKAIQKRPDSTDDREKNTTNAATVKLGARTKQNIPKIQNFNATAKK